MGNTGTRIHRLSAVEFIFDQRNSTDDLIHHVKSLQSQYRKNSNLDLPLTTAHFQL